MTTKEIKIGNISMILEPSNGFKTTQMVYAKKELDDMIFYIKDLEDLLFKNTKKIDAQKFLLDNGCDDLILNDRPYTEVKDRLYASDIMLKYMNGLINIEAI